MQYTIKALGYAWEIFELLQSTVCMSKPGENWHIGEHVLEIVDQFTYLGIIFNYNNKFTKAEKQLSEQGRKALFALKRNIRNKSYFSFISI